LKIDYSSRALVGLLVGIWGAVLVVYVHPRDVLWTLLFFTLGSLIFCQLLTVCVAQDSTARKKEQNPRETPKT
jgi:hypothetical protein